MELRNALVGFRSPSHLQQPQKVEANIDLNLKTKKTEIKKLV